MESIAEINARLRVLDEAYARLEVAAERQLELLEMLVIQQPAQNVQPGSTQNRSRPKLDPPTLGTPVGRIVDRDQEYSTDTHPALFRVVDLLESDERARTLSVRQLAQETGVSKSWCAIAKRHVMREESVH